MNPVFKSLSTSSSITFYLSKAKLLFFYFTDLYFGSIFILCMIMSAEISSISDAVNANTLAFLQRKENNFSFRLVFNQAFIWTIFSGSTPSSIIISGSADSSWIFPTSSSSPWSRILIDGVPTDAFILEAIRKHCLIWLEIEQAGGKSRLFP